MASMLSLRSISIWLWCCIGKAIKQSKHQKHLSYSHHFLGFFLLVKVTIAILFTSLALHNYHLFHPFHQQLKTITMFTSTITATALLSLLSVASAIPTPQESAPAPKVCLASFPSIIQTLSEAEPSKTFPNENGNSGSIKVSTTIDPITGQKSNRLYQLLVFKDINVGSGSCEFGFNFTAGYPITSSPSSPAPQLSFYSVGKDLTSIPYTGYPYNTWFPENTGRLSVQNIGSATLQAGSAQVINSQKCETELSFVVEIAEWVGTTASVEFNQDNQFGNGGPFNGFYIKANGPC
ncbi:hypothetical protein B0J14DRAFT_605317 [Halenospora varia]|nr:hypothetical protein B0J14DRAFT_605317 [Halenospora varia]